MTEHEIRANTVLPARREALTFQTSDGCGLVGEIALPLERDPAATIVCLHPLPTHGGMMDSHVFRKAAWRLPALADLAVVRFNTRGTKSAAGQSDGEFDNGGKEGLDLAAVLAEVAARGLPTPWLVGWSFGTSVTLRHGYDADIAGAILLSPPLREGDRPALAYWAQSGTPLVALIPEHDDYLQPPAAAEAFAQVPQIELIPVAGAKHLWVGEPSVRRVHEEIVRVVNPAALPLPTHVNGPVQTWNDLSGGVTG